MKSAIKKETYLEVYEKALNETLADPEGRLITDPHDAVYNVADRQEVENWISSDPDFQQRLSIMQQQWIKWVRTPAPESLRQTALKVLEEGGDVEALRRAKEMLGLHVSRGSSLGLIAQKLGIKVSRLRSLYSRKSRKARSGLKKIAQKETLQVKGAVRQFEGLGFSIWLPDRWRVHTSTDDYDHERPDWEKLLLEELEETPQSKLIKELGADQYRRLREEEKRGDITRKDLAWKAKLVHKSNPLSLGRYLEIRRKLKRNNKLFGAGDGSSLTGTGIQVEVKGYELFDPISAEDLYLIDTFDKRRYQRIGTRVKFIIDASEALRYQKYHDGFNRDDMQYETGAYVSDGLEGWAIYAFVDHGLMTRHKFFADEVDEQRPLTWRIIKSFKRIRVVT